MISKIFLIIAAVNIIVSGILMGAWSDRSQLRGHIVNRQDRYNTKKMKISFIMGIVGIISFIIAFLSYTLFQNL